MLPAGLRLARGGEGIGNLFLGRQLAGDEHTAVDRRDGFLDIGHGAKILPGIFVAAQMRQNGATVGGRAGGGNGTAAYPAVSRGDSMQLPASTSAGTLTPGNSRLSLAPDTPAKGLSRIVQRASTSSSRSWASASSRPKGGRICMVRLPG